MEERKLKAGLKNKCNRTFSYAFTKYYPELCIYSMSIVKNNVVAEDIVQDIFIAIWKNGDKNVVKGSLKNYLYTSVRNRCIDFLKHQKVKSKYFECLTQNESYDTPENRMSVEEIQETLRRRLNTLPPRCKQIFVLSRMDGLKNQEIAVELGLSRRTVEHHISNVLKGLRDDLKPYLAAS